MSGTIVWLDGRLVAAADAVVSVYNKGFLSGDGVFETLKVIGGVPFALTRHLRRLEASAALVGLPLPEDSELRQAIADVVAANASVVSGVGRLRVTVTGSSMDLATASLRMQASVAITVEPQQPHPESLRLVTSPWPHNDRGPLVGAKTTSYADNLAILRWARAHGADEALIFDTQDRLCEATTANIFVGFQGRLVTPTLRTGCLGGITRELLVEWGFVDEMDLTREQMQSVSEMLLASSTRDLIPVSHLDDDRVFAVPGPLGREAIQGFATRANATDDP